MPARTLLVPSEEKIPRRLRLTSGFGARFAGAGLGRDANLDDVGLGVAGRPSGLEVRGA